MTDFTHQPLIASVLQQAWERREFLLHYQPQIDLRTGAIVGVEALLRWQRPGYGLRLPQDFVGLAESTGLIVELGQWILREACRQNREWQGQGLPWVRVAVNASALQLSAALEQTVRRTLEETGLPPKYLELELTESVAFSDPLAMAMLGEIARLGVSVGVDDFGTGYACLAHLQCCPVTALKIDRRFVDRVSDDPKSHAIVQAVIALGHALDMRVVAEGVEHADDLDVLRLLNCDEAQGFLFAQAMPANALAALLAQRTTFAVSTRDTGLISCSVCCQDIPLSAALTPEGAGYVEHFCGLECFQRFAMRDESKAVSTPSFREDATKDPP
ncbi:DUF3330 domain-containing protein [Pseudoxanthomonas sp. SE1]|uniref:DUF3330 domain-containing protein n=1 Tax=Pseudoxanthomonas sp. SE1 TaxID=1664560 RepID=UPI00240D73FC|nr:DUF3330 domain-containing protein [Pseudoxanthomonas sp. SE1]WFC40269.1 DUF3330 domain-containing protein [Pseudoxanthomonas sp. SE1]WFC43728.1 DUF3330 domain-containing protein [Pseudoxanthomonas sp. SE1]